MLRRSAYVNADDPNQTFGQCLADGYEIASSYEIAALPKKLKFLFEKQAESDFFLPRKLLTPIARKLVRMQPADFFTRILPDMKTGCSLLYAEVAFVLAEEAHHRGDITAEITFILDAVIIHCNILGEARKEMRIYGEHIHINNTAYNAINFGLGKILQLDEEEANRQLSLLSPDQKNFLFNMTLNWVTSRHGRAKKLSILTQNRSITQAISDEAERPRTRSLQWFQYEPYHKQYGYCLRVIEAPQSSQESSAVMPYARF